MSASIQADDARGVLLRSVMLFVAADVFFTGFATAFAFTHFGVMGVLATIALQQVASATNYTSAFYWMRGQPARPAQLQRWGVTGLFASLALAGITADYPMVAVGILGTFGGLSRGTAWCARTWMELQHTAGAQRQAYLALSESGGTLLKIAGPLIAALVLYCFNNSFTALFLAAGVAGVLAMLLLPLPRLVTAVPTVIQPFEPWGRREFYRSAPFYLLDGFGHALRTALYVSGAMTIVKTAAGYGVVETCSSVIAAVFLAYQAHRPTAEPSLRRLRLSLGLMALGWVCLLGALYAPAILPLFIAAYALGNPLVNVVKNGLTLKGLATAGGTKHDNAIARIWLLAGARLAALGLSAMLVHWAKSPQQGLVSIVGLALLLMPFEYLFAKRLAQGTPEAS